MIEAQPTAQAASLRRLGDRGREPRRQPALVGPRRRRLPGRARRLPRRRRLRLVPGAAAGGRRPAARRRTRKRSWSSGPAPRPAPAGSTGRAPTWSHWTSRAGMLRHAREAADRSGCTRAAGPGRRAGAAVRRPARSTSSARRSARSRSWPTRRPPMREVARVLRPGGSWVFSVTHPMRWIFWDEPDESGLLARNSYFDRRPYVEQDERRRPSYVEQHRTLGDRVRELVAAGFVLRDLVEPEWPAGHEQIWGQWSPLRGRLFPGTAIFVWDLPALRSPPPGIRRSWQRRPEKGRQGHLEQPRPDGPRHRRAEDHRADRGRRPHRGRLPGRAPVQGQERQDRARRRSTSRKRCTMTDRHPRPSSATR